MVLLGNWQMQRLDWKLNLIEAVESRAFGAPVAAPRGPVTEDEHAYLRVDVTGRFRHDLSRKVKALTELGGGHWLLTPLQTESSAIWINRGFVPSGSDRGDWLEPEGLQRVEGLLRISEPNGTLLQKNDPAAGRWYSRDVEALNEDVGLIVAESYFIDADHAAGPEDWPRGGLTVVDFRNTHLSYALTWYAMAVLFFGAIVYVIRDRLKQPKRKPD